jgi:hypothetical protein
MKLDIYKCPILKYRVENIFVFCKKSDLDHIGMILFYNKYICYDKKYIHFVVKRFREIFM